MMHRSREDLHNGGDPRQSRHQLPHNEGAFQVRLCLSPVLLYPSLLKTQIGTTPYRSAYDEFRLIPQLYQLLKAGTGSHAPEGGLVEEYATQGPHCCSGALRTSGQMTLPMISAPLSLSCTTSRYCHSLLQTPIERQLWARGAAGPHGQIERQNRPIAQLLLWQSPMHAYYKVLRFISCWKDRSHQTGA